jgi:tetratricopeptide (TPR) repeat protein
MNEKRIKYIFWYSSALLLVLMLLLSKNAGISCDEVLHYDHSVAVYNYFASHGEDQSALNTPVTNLKYYGQSYDNLVTILARWFQIEDVYYFRHLMSSVAGWLVFFITALFALWLADYKTAVIVLLLFAVSPGFLGHTQNNLKDIPFALGYISGIYFTLKFLFSDSNVYRNSILLAASIGFTISIRAGGLILLCYLFFFFFVFYFFKYLTDKKVDLIQVRKKFFLSCGITVVSWLSGILLWPFALHGPFRNMIESYRVMAHFPSTFRQIFEGRVEWSDYMPWYYIPKSMLITIPIIVTLGLVLFLVLMKVRNKPEKALQYGFIFFTLLFPLFFVIYEKSNVYSSWRQFLFLYPAIVLFAAIGFSALHGSLRNIYLKWGLFLVMALLTVHPLKFMLKNPHFYYLYYNQLVGGLKGAYTNYETDYYYISQTQASAWLIDYLRDKNPGKKVKVKATYSVKWQFRNNPEIENSYFRFEEKSMSDWDYAIVVNRYISPFKLRNKTFPPSNAIHTIYAEGVPVCAVLERKSKDDYAGYVALNEGRSEDAIRHFEKVVRIDDSDEMIFYNFGAALFNNGQYQKADSVLKRGLEVNPDYEPILMYLGNIARSQNKPDEAIRYYKRVIEADRKYFEAYVGAAELLTDKDTEDARKLLKTCLDMNPRFKPAIKALAETYRISDPDIARKYDELADSIR